jgi:hypothetical protein
MIHLWLQVNRIGFEFTALIKVEGALTVEATYEPVGPARVDIRFRRSTLVCTQQALHTVYVARVQQWMIIEMLSQQLSVMKWALGGK